MPSPNIITTAIQDERQEGALSEFDPLSLDLPKEVAARAIGNRVERSEAFWNSELKLDQVRKDGEKYWLNESLDTTQLYDYQAPYKDNRIFVDVETLIPMAISRPAQPVVTEAFDTDASRELAKNIQKTLLALYEDQYVKGKLMMVARHLLIGHRIGIMKYRWDNTIGQLKPDGTRSGNIAIDYVRPTKVVFDERANDPDNIPLIAEYMTASVEELVYKFPDAKDDIWRLMGIQRGVATQLSKKVGYVEVWFTYYDDNGTPHEGVAWKLKNVVMGSMKNPNWNYNETQSDGQGGIIYNNFLDRPRKPYVLFNYLNLGKYVLDDTSLTEQAAIPQDILNKRGRQIVENADSANGGTVLNEQMINQDAASELTGDPREILMANGPVNQAAARLPVNLLPEYVIADKQDSRNVIDNIFGAHAPIRGDRAASPTLGQEVLSQRSDMGRNETLATAVEDGMDRLYKGIVQMMKVFYDENMMIKYTGPEGKTTFLEFSGKQVEMGVTADGKPYGCDIRVKSGSILPDDEAARQQQTIQLAPLLDPLSLGEGLNKPDPKEFAKRIMYFKMAPDKYLQDFLGETPDANTDPGAITDIQQINSGQNVPPQENPSQNHLAQHQAFMESPQFKTLDPMIQQLHIAHNRGEVANARTALKQEPQTQTKGEQSNPEAPVKQEKKQNLGLMARAMNLLKGGKKNGN